METYTGPDPGYKPMQGVSYGNGGLVRPDADSTRVVFFSKAKLMPAKSRDAGRQVWENVDYVSVQQATEKYPILLEAHDGHRQRWAREYEAYQKGKEALPEGTPMSILMPGNEAVVNELKSMAIYTIEQMAAVPDSVLHRIPFGLDLKNRARKYLEAVNGSQGFNKMQAEIEKANERAADTERQLADLKEQLASMQKPETPSLSPDIAALVATLVAQNAQKTEPKTRRGRPPKADVEEAA